MSLTGTLFSLYARRRLRSLQRTGDTAVDVQLSVFRELMKTAKDTAWGRQYGYADLDDPAAFRQRVPVTDYESMRPVWHRAFDGERDVTWPGHIRYFALSSGTTAGNKLLPVSREAIRSNRRAGGDLLSLLVQRGGAEKLAAGRFFYLGGSTALRRRGRCLYGDASGIMGRHIPFYARRRYLPDPAVAEITDWEDKIARIVDACTDAKVCALSGCPSWVSLLFRQLQEKTGTPVGETWPDLAFFVSYGMSFEPYRTAFEEQVGRPIHYVDTYSSSEGGMTAIAAADGGPLRLIVDNGVFFEFIPAGKAAGDCPPRLHLGEVETGVDYAVLLSTNSGIWAYPLGDVIRFESLSPPAIRFAGRTAVYLSAFGEHVTVEMLETAVAAACGATGAAVNDYTVCPRFPAPEHPRPVHRWIVEFARPPADPDAFMQVLDETIRRENEDYDTHRLKDYGMDPPLLYPVRAGTFYAWMKARGQLGGQHKVPRVITDEDDFSFLTGE